MAQTSRLRKHKASGHWTIWIAGKTHYLGKDRSQAQRRAASLLAEHAVQCDTAQNGTGRELTVGELFARHLEHARKAYLDPKGRPNGDAQAFAHLTREATKLYGDLPISKFGPLALCSLRQTYVQRGVCRTHANRVADRVRRVVRWGVGREMASPMVLEALKAVGPLRAGTPGIRESTPRRPATWAEVERTVPYMALAARAAILVLWWSGARPGEVLGLRWSDIDTTGPIWLAYPKRHKNTWRGFSREIVMGPKAQEAMRPLLRPSAKAPVFPSRDPRIPLTPQALLQAVRRACQVAKTDWYPYMIRHAAATRLRKEVGLEAARVVLGHKSAFTTEIYAEVDQARAREIAARMG